jgi:hypothetical protein
MTTICDCHARFFKEDQALVICVPRKFTHITQNGNITNNVYIVENILILTLTTIIVPHNIC